nr:YigZ family protein [Lachnoclostridium sp. MSJ-17]
MGRGTAVNKDYKTVANEASDEFVEKRSRFIGYVKPVRTEEEAVAFINQKRSEHWDARHNVYAYSLREGNIKRYSDDGEPSGTAGMPVLDVIVKNEIYDVCVVVTRYFGGVLLGTGGLVRAYSQGSKIALESGGVVLMQSCLLCETSCSYTRYGKVSSLIMESGATVDDTIYESDVKIKFHIPPGMLDGLNKKLADATSGEVQAVSDGESYFMTPVNS